MTQTTRIGNHYYLASDTTLVDCPICEGRETVRVRYGKGRCQRCPSEFVVLDGELVATQKATVKMSYGGKAPRRLPPALARIAQSGRR